MGVHVHWLCPFACTWEIIHWKAAHCWKTNVICLPIARAHTFTLHDVRPTSSSLKFVFKKYAIQRQGGSLEIKSANCSSRGPQFNSHHPHVRLTLPMTLLPESLVPSGVFEYLYTWKKLKIVGKKATKLSNNNNNKKNPKNIRCLKYDYDCVLGCFCMYPGVVDWTHYSAVE